MSQLTGASLFLFPVAFLNFRSPGPAETVDWVVMGAGAAFFPYALVRRLRP